MFRAFQWQSTRCTGKYPDMNYPTSLRQDLRVLVVDSHADSRDLLRMVFEEYGVEAIGATSVSQSLQIMHQKIPDIVISEIALLGEDGYSLVDKVKVFEIMYGVRIPVIALTVYARPGDRIQALTAGFCRYLTKPLDIDELVTTVAQITAYPGASAISV